MIFINVYVCNNACTYIRTSRTVHMYVLRSVHTYVRTYVARHVAMCDSIIFTIGNFGVVYKGWYEKESMQVRVAIKILIGESYYLHCYTVATYVCMQILRT